MFAQPNFPCTLSPTREIAEFPIANIPLTEHSRRVGVSPTRPLTFHPHAWLDPADMAAFSASGASALVDSEHLPLAWSGPAPDLSRTFPAATSFIIRYPWDFLRANELYVSALTGDSITAAG